MSSALTHPSGLFGGLALATALRRGITALAIALAQQLFVEAAQGQVYWADWGSDGIYHMSLGGGDSTLLLPAPFGRAADLEIDPHAGLLYLADTELDRIVRCNLDGTGAAVIVLNQPQPIDMALDLAGGKLYWTDNIQNKILRSNLDGTQLETFHTVVSTDTYAPFSIAFDYIARRVYWSEGSLIRSAKTDGSDQRLEASGGALAISGMAIDPVRRVLFWTISMSIRFQSLDDDRIRTLFVTPFGDHALMDVKIDLSQRHLYWADQSAGTINRCRYDGSEHVTLQTTESQPGAIAINCDTTPVLPHISDIEALPGGSFLAHFGYLNTDAFLREIPIGNENQIAPGPPNQGQPGQFLPGLHNSVFAVEFTGLQPQWRLNQCETGGEDCDADGATDSCEPDWDGDLFIDDCDNCPDDHNADQADVDTDGWGDLCDVCQGYDDTQDSDNDFVPDGCDLCPGSPDSADDDHDLIPDACDNCPQTYNFDQADSDGDGYGDACDHCEGFDDTIDADFNGFIDGCTPCEIVPDVEISPPPDFTGSEFAAAIAVHDDVLVVGAAGPSYDACFGAGTCTVGSVLVYRRDETGWIWEATLVSSENVVSDRFGLSVAVEDSLVVVGAPRADISSLSPFAARGAVFIFRRDSGNWILDARLASLESTGSDRFGTAVAISDGRIAVGNPHENVNGVSTGSVHMYEYVDGEWVRVQRLLNSTGEIDDHFGEAIGLDGPDLVVGAPWTDVPTVVSGAVYFFRRGPAQWSLQSRIAAHPGRSALEFGQSVDVHNEMAVVSSPDENVALNGQSTFRAGAIYVYERTGSTWTETGRITEQRPWWSGYFGASVAIDHNTIVTITGAHGGNTATAREVHVLQRNELVWETRAILASPPMRTSSSIINGTAIHHGDVFVGQPIDASYPPFPNVAFHYSSIANCDTNGELDACQAAPPPACIYARRGDLNRDGIVSEADITWFVQALLTSNGSTTGWTVADMDRDSRLNARDIEPFVVALLAP